MCCADRLKKELGYWGEVWQRQFSQPRIDDRESYLRYRESIAQNPVRAGLVNSGETFPYCFTHLAKQRMPAI
jgi:putative transposase